MDEVDTRKWENMEIDILVKIFQDFDVFEMTSSLAHVCCMWRYAACQVLLEALDLSILKSDFIRVQVRPYVYVNSQSDKQFMKLLKISLNLRGESITSLFFHFYQYVSDDQLTYIAKRCPKLKRLVLPSWNRIKETGILKAFSSWKDLESLTIANIYNPSYLMKTISENCKKFSQLKIMGECDEFLAQTLTRYIPNLKVLSLRCSIVYKNALIHILNELKYLEVLNISHCFIVEYHPQRPLVVTRKVLDDLLLMKGLRLRRVLTCLDDFCDMCQKTKADKGLLKWYRYEEGLWKDDEVKSLAV